VTFARKPLIGYNNTSWIKNSKIGISIENPNSDIFATQGQQNPQVYPDFVVNYVYNKDDLHLKFAAIQRSFIYADTVQNIEQVETDGFGFMLSGSVQATKKVKFRSQLTYGKGISEYLSLARELVPSGNGKFAAPRIYALFASVTYKINYRSNISAFYSFVEQVDQYELGDGEFSRGQQINLNYILELTPTMSTGIEAISGVSDDFGGGRGSAARLYVFFLMSF
jgi:hypothetical protein